MKPIAEMIRELVDTQSRPGQPGGAVAADRMLTANLLWGSGSTFATRYDWEADRTIQYGVYGRSRYGQKSYLQA